MIEVHGLKTCDTCRKALKWLSAEGIAHRFHDVRADGVTAAQLAGWADAVGWEVLLNRRGTTWRGLPAAETGEVDRARALALMERHPALIKRPVFALPDGTVLVGFAAKQQEALRAALR